LALAAALGELTLYLRRARTMLWCSLQLGSCDLPVASINAAKQSSKKNVSIHYPLLPSTAVHRTLFHCLKSKSLTRQMGSIDVANICDDDDDDDVFTYVDELFNDQCRSCLLDDAVQQM